MTKSNASCAEAPSGPLKTPATRAAEKKRPGRDDPLQKTLVGQIASQNEGRAPSCFDIRTDRIERRAVGEDEIGAELRQANGSRPPDTAGSTRDQGSPALQAEGFWECEVPDSGIHDPMARLYRRAAFRPVSAVT